MIQFRVIIQERPDGQVSVQCETPPGSATMREADLGRAFMEMLKAFTLTGGKTTIVTDWKGSNDTKRN